MRAFISVSDKNGIVPFAKGLAALGVTIISTGGTASALSKAGVSVTGVEEITGFAECLDGRVKTLHPNIHAGILAMRSNGEHMAQLKKLNIEPIDIVVVNLYPFKQTILKPDVALHEAIENIDIGGPSMLRAAAKNYQDVAVIVDPEDYEVVLSELKDGGVSAQTKFRLCAKVFNHTAAYDALISQYLSPLAGMPDYPQSLTLTYEKKQDMRYGENPHQTAAFYGETGARPGTLMDAEQLWGKELSYNNIGDADGALALIKEFNNETAVVAVKHANPCGVGVDADPFKAYMKAYEADPVSIFGGIVALNFEVGKEIAEHMASYFLEIVIAQSFTEEALEILKTKKNLRLLRLPSINAKTGKYFETKKVLGGLLVQNGDGMLLEGKLENVTHREPNESEIKDLMFAWKIVKHVKSNAIVVARNGQSLGIGPGQVNRIWAVKSAIERAGDKVVGAALASDAYFPFADCVEEAAGAGIRCIIQPGGSIRDQDSIDACNTHGVAMVFTNMRHFKH